jgi:hypothetical protein
MGRADDSESGGSPRLFFAEQKAVRKMLSQCANSQCGKPFLKLREGKLFLVETDRLTRAGESAALPFVRARQQQRCVEHFWLCDDCAAQWTLVFDRDTGVGLAPLRRPAVNAAATAVTAQSGAA